MCGTATDKTCRIVIDGAELVELKRHAHQIPECPGLDRRIQRYDGNRPLAISLDELDWLVAVLNDQTVTRVSSTTPGSSNTFRAPTSDAWSVGGSTIG